MTLREILAWCSVALGIYFVYFGVVALLGLVLYAAALLAQGLSVTDVLPSRRKQKAARG